MKTSNKYIALLGLFVSFSALAEEQVISVPGEGWRIRFEAPQLKPQEAAPGLKNNIFFGRAENFQLSFFVDAPRCPGGDSDENIYACFTKALKSNPIVEWETERGNTVPSGILVGYYGKLEVNGQTGRSFNLHILFARNGKWADVHGSMASPTRADVAKLFDIMNSIKIETEEAKAR